MFDSSAPTRGSDAIDHRMIVWLVFFIVNKSHCDEMT